MNDRQRALSAIAHLVNVARDEAGHTAWHPQGVVAALGKTDETEPIPTIAVAALIAAVTRPDQHTPGVIPLPGEHWTAARTALGQSTDRPPRIQPAVCPHRLHPRDCPDCIQTRAERALRGGRAAREAFHNRGQSPYQGEPE